MTGEERFEAIASDLAEIKGCVARLETAHAVHAKGHEAIDMALADHKETLYGNGHPGLKADVARIESQCDVRCAKMENSYVPAWQRILIGIVTGAGSALIVAFVVWLFWMGQTHPKP